MHRRFAATLWAVLASTLWLAACGGGPSSPSEDGVRLRGTVLGDGNFTASAAGAAREAAATVTVTVQENPAITTTVAADGTFTLRGLPPGGFTLVFTSGGTTIGVIPFAEVLPNQEITISVRVDGRSLVVVEERRNGIGHGALEIEGRVESVVALDPAGDSVFVIDGERVVARPGVTTIREGNRARSVTDVTVGRAVHVKGTFMLANDSASQRVLAQEIILQGGSTTGNGPGPTAACAAGANAEVEGLITGKGGSSITVTQQAKGDYLCAVSGSTRIRKGNRTYTFAELQTGWRVHVKGTQQGPSGSACQVSASEIMVQNN
jgi:hypothetical protein